MRAAWVGPSPTACSSIAIASLWVQGHAVRRCCEGKIVASSFLGWVPASTESIPAPRAGTKPWRTLAVILAAHGNQCRQWEPVMVSRQSVRFVENVDRFHRYLKLGRLVSYSVPVKTSDTMHGLTGLL